MIAATGWTWEYIDQHMTIPRLEAMNLYWKDNPPLHVMVAAYFGIGKKETKATEDDNLEDILSMMPQVPYEEKK